ERRAVVPLGGLVCLDFLMLGQQLLEPADVPLDDRADEDQRRSLIAGRRGDLATGHKLEAALIAQSRCASIPRLPSSPTNRMISGSPQAALQSRTFSNSAQRASNQRQPSALSSSRRTITAGSSSALQSG